MGLRRNFLTSTPPVPDFPHVEPRNVSAALDSSKFTRLKEQRDIAYEHCRTIDFMNMVAGKAYREARNYDEYLDIQYSEYNRPDSPTAHLSDSQKEDLVMTPEKIRARIDKIEHTTLCTAGSENRDFMLRMLRENNEPFQGRLVCSRLEKAALIVDYLQENPQQAYAIVVGQFPNGHTNPDAAAREIYAVREFFDKHGITANRIEVDTVRNPVLWGRGEMDLCRKIAQAEMQASADCGLPIKSILTISAHPYADFNKLYGADSFASIYDMGQMEMEEAHKAGIENFFLKTCTGQGVAAPYHNFSPQDASYPSLAAPMYIVAGDFNAQNATGYRIKDSGGNKNEFDGIAKSYLHDQTNGRTPGLKGELVQGASGPYRDRLLRYLVEMETIGGPPCGFDPAKIFQVENIEAQSLSRHAGPAFAKPARPTPKRLQVSRTTPPPSPFDI